MSGGSFNYLYHKELHDIAFGVGEEWDWMLDELDRLCPEAAQEMRKIREHSRTFIAEHEPRWQKLQPLLRDIEWWRSFDYGKDQVNEAIEKYRAERAFVEETS